MAVLQLAAWPRTEVGRKVKQLRREGLVPVVVYGGGVSPQNLQVNARSLNETIHGGGSSQLVELMVDGGETHNVLIREVQRHPVSHSALHADFYAVSMTETQQVTVVVNPVGEPEALVAGFMVLQAMDAVDIEALPAAIPGYIEIDISSLSLENTITVADLPKLPGVEYLADLDEPVFTIVTTRAEEEEEEEEIEDIGIGEPEVVSRRADEDEE